MGHYNSELGPLPGMDELDKQSQQEEQIREERARARILELLDDGPQETGDLFDAIEAQGLDHTTVNRAFWYLVGTYQISFGERGTSNVVKVKNNTP